MESENDEQEQKDGRADVSFGLTAEVYGQFESGVPYGAEINVSNTDNADERGRDLNYENLNFIRHMVGANVSLTF